MSDLKNRERYTSSLDIMLLNKLKQLSKKTRVPISRLLDEAIVDLLKKYERG